ncbi:hypothetical protein [Pseudomonas sp. HLMP]|uniref:hypothetical protein n=1 Tax=Pseudomonas sp. HLMP TaxID=3153767 RepID=UPI003967B8A7
MSRKIVLDTNLLILLVVGLYEPNYISQHKNLQDYSLRDFEDLIVLIDGADIVVTTAVLAEASNLLWQTSPPHKQNLRRVLGELISKSMEHRPVSIQVAESTHFMQLGLTDAGILELPAGSGVILTVDLDLHLAALEKGLETENFTHYRDFS